MYGSVLKRISIPKAERLLSIGVNKINNLIAVGGTNGFLQIINYELSSERMKKSRLSESKSQTLTLHKADVILVAWNSIYDKLTSCDSSGRVLVWRGNKGLYKAEMENERSENAISKLEWSPFGNFICFLYKDGYIILGSVRGDRMWGKRDLEKPLSFEWSIDEKNIITITDTFRIKVLSLEGDTIMTCQLNTQDLVGTLQDFTLYKNISVEEGYSISEQNNLANTGALANTSVLKIDNLNASNFNPSPATNNLQSIKRRKIRNLSKTPDKNFLVAFKEGFVILQKDLDDPNPKQIDTNLITIKQIKWGKSTKYFFILGLCDDGENDCIAIYNRNGEQCGLIKLPEEDIMFGIGAKGTSCITLGKNTINYVIVRSTEYKWWYYNDIIIYGFQNSAKEYEVTYWSAKHNITKSFNCAKLINISGSDNFSVVGTQEKEDTYRLSIIAFCGVMVENVLINICPTYMANNEIGRAHV